MKRGYTIPLYLLPFDHRNSYVKGMFNFSGSLSTEQRDKVADSKQVIYEGFQQAVGNGISTGRGGLLVDEEFGALILRDAAQKGYITALSTEKSGSDEFEFEYGDEFASHIEQFDPTFAKVLVRYNTEGDDALNRRQDERLRRLSDYCQNTGRLFMFELLVPATSVQMERVKGNKETYDLDFRPELMARAIAHLQDQGIEPDVWKIEGLDRRSDCEHIVETVRRGGRVDASCIVLGRGADELKVAHWLTVAATVPGFIGYAVGRTTFWDAIADYEAGRATRQQASARIAARYGDWARTFEQNRPSRNSSAARSDTEVRS
jgi:myo-inositol catabolism protein IolC